MRPLWIVLTMAALVQPDDVEFVFREDPLALLSGTLRTYQKAACDDEVVTLRCPHGTTISVQLAQYGKSAPSSSPCAPPLPLAPPILPNDGNGNVTCLWPMALQYSLLQMVVGACQKKRSCKFQTSPKAFGGDPCPGTRKYIEVAYKCRPSEFRSKVACEDDVIQIQCNKTARIAIYSASYGRTEYESIQCPQPLGVPEETCLASYATETVMQMCHGKRRCALSADPATFGNPCRPESRMYLKVVYTCVPRKILKEKYQGEAEDDEVPEEDVYDSYETEEVVEGAVAMSPSPDLQDKDGDPKSGVKTTPRPFHKGSKNTGNEEKFYLYLILSVTGGLLIFLSLVIGRLLVQRHRTRRHENKPQFTDPLPNGFGDDLSELDPGDLELGAPSLAPPPAAPLPSSSGSVPSGSEVVRFATTSRTNTVQRQDSDTNPRSLSRGGNSQYYYS